MLHRQAIALGARWMDRNYPGWHEQVNPDTLHPSDQSCVIGQVEGSFWELMNVRYPVVSALRARAKERWWWLMLLYPGFWCAAGFIYGLGFDSLRTTDLQWREAWRREIMKRRTVTFPQAWVEEKEKEYVS